MSFPFFNPFPDDGDDGTTPDPSPATGSGGMTRAEIKDSASGLLMANVGGGDTQADEMDNDPFALDHLLDAVADEFARATDCFYTSLAADLVVNQTAYCLPNIYKLKAAGTLQSTGRYMALELFGPREADRVFGAARWRNTPENGGVGAAHPWIAVLSGLNTLTFAPAPTVAVAGGLVLEGYAVPRGLWDADDAECPLPGWSHQALVFGLCQKMCLRLIGKKSWAGAQAQAWGAEWRAARNDGEAKAALFKPPVRRAGEAWY